MVWNKIKKQIKKTSSIKLVNRIIKYFLLAEIPIILTRSFSPIEYSKALTVISGIVLFLFSSFFGAVYVIKREIRISPKFLLATGTPAETIGWILIVGNALFILLIILAFCNISLKLSE